MSERTDCAFYSEWQDMNATVPCCDIYGIGNCKCSDCKKYVSENDRVVVVRCKDCKHCEHQDFPSISFCHRTEYCLFEVDDDFYCKGGERKDYDK